MTKASEQYRVTKQIIVDGDQHAAGAILRTTDPGTIAAMLRAGQAVPAADYEQVKPRRTPTPPSAAELMENLRQFAKAEQIELTAKRDQSLAAGVGIDAANAAQQNLRVVASTPGATAAEVLSRGERTDAAFAQAGLAFANSQDLRRAENELAAIEQAFPENPGDAKLLNPQLTLPAALRTACNNIGFNPYTTAWPDFGKPPENENPRPRQVRRTEFLRGQLIEAEAGLVSLKFEGDALVSLTAAAGDNQLPTFTMKAYTGGKMYPRGFNIPVVLDLSSASVVATQTPVFMNHDSNKIVGHGNVEVTATGIMLSDGVISGAGPAAEEVRLSAKRGFPWKPSIGANPERMEFIEAGKQIEVNGRKHKGPLYVARAAVVHEISFVPLAGDPKATASIAANRGGQVAEFGSRPLTAAERAELEQSRAARRRGTSILQASADPNEAVLSHMRRVAIAAGLNPGSPYEIMAATSGIPGFSFNNLVSGPIIEGFHAGADSTLGWTRRVPLPDFNVSELATVNEAVRLSQVARGETAAHIQYGMSSPAGWKLAKFGVKFQIDEQDLVNGLRMQHMQVSLEEIGKAFARLIPDMVWSYLLSNPTLADDVVLFHSSRGNIGTGGGSALQLSALATGVGAIGNQTLPVERGGVAHMNPTAKYLITPPGLNITARGLAVDVNVGDESDLVVRSESRLGTAGVIDPLVDDILAGTATNWMLTAPTEQAPSIFVGTLGGATQPTIRPNELKHGSWGIEYDIQFSVGVVAVDGRGLYWATGA